MAGLFMAGWFLLVARVRLWSGRLAARATGLCGPGAAMGVAIGLALLIPTGAGAATRSYIVTDFDSLRLDAPIEVTVETGRGISARGEGDREALERIDLTVSARVLTIRLRPSSFEGRRAGPAATTRLILTVPALRRIQFSGAGTLHAKGLERGTAEIVAAGSGSLFVTGVDSDGLVVTQLGSGSIMLAGKTKSVALRISGAGVVDAGALEASDLDLRLDGPASVTAKAQRAARIVAVGPGSVTVAGKGACTVNHAGSGTVQCGGADY